MKNRQNILRTLVVSVGCLGAVSAFTQALKVGMNAPPIKVGEWVKGTPVNEFKPGAIYVVEFWATWCGPCKQTIPLLTQLAKEEAGKVTVIGVSTFENNTAD